MKLPNLKIDKKALEDYGIAEKNQADHQKLIETLESQVLKMEQQKETADLLFQESQNNMTHALRKFSAENDTTAIVKYQKKHRDLESNSTVLGDAIVQMKKELQNIKSERTALMQEASEKRDYLFRLAAESMELKVDGFATTINAYLQLLSLAGTRYLSDSNTRGELLAKKFHRGDLDISIDNVLEAASIKKVNS